MKQLYRVKNALSHYGGRVPRGEVLELDDEMAATYGPDLVEPVDAEDAPEPGTAPEPSASESEPESEPEDESEGDEEGEEDEDDSL